MKSLLDGVDAADVSLDPFPHVVVREPVEPALCERLIGEFPLGEQVAGGPEVAGNTRLSYGAHCVAEDGRIAPLWREFVAAHTTQEFLDRAMGLFEPHLEAWLPGFARRFGKPHELRAGTRHVDSFDTCDVMLDAQICVNTPVRDQASSVRRAHVDSVRKIFAGLYYLRRPEDRTERGGDLVLYRCRRRLYRFGENQRVDDRDIEQVKTVPYDRNVLVLFLNGPRAIHGVTPRDVSDCPRCFFNLLGQVDRPLFRMRGTLASRWRDWRRHRQH